MGPRVADEEERKLHVNSGGLEEEEEDEDEEANVGGGGKRSSESSDEPDEAGTADGAGDGEEQLQRHRHKKPPCKFGNYTRYLVMLLTTLCLSLTMSNSMALNFTVICMSKAVNDDEEAASDAVQQQQQLAAAVSNLTATAANTIAVNAIRPMFNNAEKALLFSAVPVGTLIGTLPITPLTSRFGMRLTFTMYGLISGLATLLTPVAAVNDFGMLLIMRVLQGVAVSICFPASGSIIADWSPLRSAGTYIAFLSCHIQFGPILTMPLAGELCESSWGWPAVYYLQAVLTALVFGAFYAFYRDSPRLHRNVSQKELCRIERGKPGLDAGPERHEVPYAAMLRDPAVWAVFLCSMGSTFGFHVFMQYGPTYLNQTIKFDVARTGFAMALPCLLSALTKFVVGPASDYATCVSERTRVLLFASVSQFLMAFCFCALALLPSTSPSWLIQCFFTSVTVVSGLNCAGVGKSTQMISRQFAHVITSFSVFVSSITIITIPCIVSVLVPDNLPEQWSRIFLIVAVTVVACVIFFDCTAEASPRPWTFTKKRPTTIQAKTTIVAQKGEMMDKHGNGGKMMPLLIVVPSEGPKQQQKQQPTTVPPVATNSLANA